MNIIKTFKNKPTGIVVVVAAAILLLSLIAPGYGAKESRASKRANGEQLYMANCEACHMFGINVIKPDKALVRSEKLASQKIFKDFISQKHGVMPPFEDLANDPVDVKDLYHFTRKLRVSSWDYPMKTPSDGEVDPEQPEPR
jgi:mono/diheme cytochrome c family protein